MDRGICASQFCPACVPNSCFGKLEWFSFGHRKVIDRSCVAVSAASIPNHCFRNLFCFWLGHPSKELAKCLLMPPLPESSRYV